MNIKFYVLWCDCVKGEVNNKIIYFLLNLLEKCKFGFVYLFYLFF